MRPTIRLAGLAMIGLPVLFTAVDARSQSPTAEQLAAQIEALKKDYNARVTALEAQIEALKAGSGEARQPAAAPPRPAPSNQAAFNPAIGIVLDGKFSSFSTEGSEMPGFRIGHESERPGEGFSLGHSEISMSGNIDDKFRGALSLGLGVHPGEPTEVELEEAYIQTLPGAGLPDGVRLKAGRALWTFDYLNEQHRHADDFVDRPLPHRAFLDGAYNDDGAELSVVLPADFYGELGGGVFRGDDWPFGGSETGREAWSLFARVGGDVGANAAWRLGAYLLNGRARNRTGGGAHAHNGHGHDNDEDDDHNGHAHDDDEGEEHDNGHNGHAHNDVHGEEHEEHHDHDFAELFSNGMFTGGTRLYGIDFRLVVAPTGNPRNNELILQGGYFRRAESGAYTLEEEHCDDDDDLGHPICTIETASEDLNGDSGGWYVQTVYKFLPRWRIGARYSQLEAPRDSGLDHDPYTLSAMVDWTNSEFGRFRAQFNREALGAGEIDNQFILQYVMNLGAHAAHSF